MDKKLPTYRVTIDGDGKLGLDFVSIVDDPAIEVMGLAFSNQSQPTQMRFDDVKQIIAGPALIPNKLIYRIDEESGEEFNVVFTEEDIEAIVENFNSRAVEFRVNVDHKEISESSFIKSNWIIEDPANDKSKMYGMDLPKGTWFMEVKVKDREEFLRYKDSGKTGFSVEGAFSLVKIKMNKTMKLMKTKLKDGTEISISGETLEVGANVFVYDEEGNEVQAPAGEHVLETGETIVVDETGKITEIKTEEVETEEVLEKDKKEEEEEVKMAISPEDVNLVWEAIAPKIEAMIMEVLKRATEEDFNNRVKAVEEEFNKKVEDLKFSIKTTPATGSITKDKNASGEISKDEKFSKTVNELREIRKHKLGK